MGCANLGDGRVLRKQRGSDTHEYCIRAVRTGRSGRGS